MKERFEHPLTLAAFGAMLSEKIEWKPFSAFPPSARLAVLVGEPSEKGLYTVRVRVPKGVKLMPHRHREDRVYMSHFHWAKSGEYVTQVSGIGPLGIDYPRPTAWHRPVPSREHLDSRGPAPHTRSVSVVASSSFISSTICVSSLVAQTTQM